VAFGGNVGDPKATYLAAAEMLREVTGIHSVTASPLYRTAAVGSEAGGEYRNGALRLETSLEPIELFRVLESVERRFGRVRSAHWGPRTIDLDLALAGPRLIHEPSLVVPHPRLATRVFALQPIVDLDSDAVHPILGLSVAELLKTLRSETLTLLVAGRGGALSPVAMIEVERSLGEMFRLHCPGGRLVVMAEPIEEARLIRHAGRVLGVRGDREVFHAEDQPASRSREPSFFPTQRPLTIHGRQADFVLVLDPGISATPEPPRSVRPPEPDVAGAPESAAPALDASASGTESAMAAAMRELDWFLGSRLPIVRDDGRD
jgi:2-amino-4-hydroxy-6-hydroxymethyldihydropteridine diphosphokinase